MPARRSHSPKSKSKPYTRPSRPVAYIDLSDDEILNEQPPALSSPSSNGNDASSDYDPIFETPTKVGRGSIKNMMYVFEDDEDDEMKPDISDDDMSYPGIIGDEHQEEYDEEEKCGKKDKGKGKGKAKGPTKTTPKKPKVGSGSVGGSGKKPGVVWTGDQDWILFQQMHPKVTPNWANAASQVGRDSKSCQNRYAVFAKKLEAMIKGMSNR